MVMKTHFKVSLRLFGKHKMRLLTIICIVIISVAFMFGILEVEHKIAAATNNLYEQQNISDLYLKSKNITGFSQKEKELIYDRFKDDKILESLCYEYEEYNKITRIYNYDLKTEVNQLEVVEGRLPSSYNEIVVERKTNSIEKIDIGESLSIQGINYEVVGIVFNPLLIIENEEFSFIKPNDNIDRVIYMNSENLLICNDIYISFIDKTIFDNFSSKYEKLIKDIKLELKSLLGDNVEVLSLYENYGLYSLDTYAKKVSTIGIIFVVFFLLITILVVYSTMSRLLDEERPQLACLKTLGYSNLKIVQKYIWFVAIAILIGSLISSVVGLFLTKIIYRGFNLQYHMPTMPKEVNLLNYFFVVGIILISIVTLMYVTSLKEVNKKPVQLLVPKAPKKGKKVLLEKIPFIWKRLSFKYKSTFRNVFLFKSRFLMTVVSIIGSTVLVFAGMGLLDCTIKMENAELLFTISIALIFFSGFLCALVIYNITNINISERKREIATLMVLGYHDNEVSGYIYREIYIMSAIGAILGIPFGYLFIDFVFSLIDFGKVEDINWWTWILAPIITMIFSVISTFLLYRKITKTDMNASLKTLE